MANAARRVRAGARGTGPARVFLLLALALYLLLALYQWDRPAPDPDETLDAVPAMQLLLGQRLDNHWVLRLGGREWPVMVMPYIGAMSTYLLLPAIGLLGAGTLALRLTGVALGLLSLLLAWGFLREYLDERVASLAVLLLAVNPSYVFWTRMNAYVALPVLPLAIGALWSLYRWYRGRGAGYLVLAAFCLGLGLSTKILFVWLWIALGVAWLVLSARIGPKADWQAWLWPLRRAGVCGSVLGFLALVLGSGMLLAYNLQSLSTMRLILQSLRSSQMYGIDNLDVLGNLQTRVGRDFATLLDGSWFMNHLGAAHANPLGAPALILAAIVLLGLLLRGKLSYSARRLALLALLLAAIVFQSAFTVTGFGAQHLVIAWPIPQALIATALFGAADAWTRSLKGIRWERLALIAVLAAGLVGGEAWTTWRYHHTLARSGGGLHTDPIYALTHDLQLAGMPVVALDWGFRRSLQFFSQGRINPEDGFDYSHQPGEHIRAYLEVRVKESPALYLFRDPERTVFRGHWELFQEVCYSRRLTPVLWNRYNEVNGRPAFLVYSLVPTPRLFQMPDIAYPLDMRLGDGLVLLGYDLERDSIGPDEEIRLTLYWQALTRQTTSYKVFAHLVDTTDSIHAQWDGVPHNWGYPTTEWLPGEIVVDRIRLAPKAALPAGDYRLLVGMYHEGSGERLPLLLAGERVANDRLEVARISVGVQAQ